MRPVHDVINSDPFGWAAAPEDREVGVFWDCESCSAPPGKSGYEIARELKKMAQSLGSKIILKVYLPVSAVSSVLHGELQSAGLTVHTLAPGLSEDVGRRLVMLVTDMFLFALPGEKKKALILITGDDQYTYALSTLLNSGHDAYVLSESDEVIASINRNWATKQAIKWSEALNKHEAANSSVGSLMDFDQPVRAPVLSPTSSSPLPHPDIDPGWTFIPSPSSVDRRQSDLFRGTFGSFGSSMSPDDSPSRPDRRTSSLASPIGPSTPAVQAPLATATTANDPVPSNGTPVDIPTTNQHSATTHSDTGTQPGLTFPSGASSPPSEAPPLPPIIPVPSIYFHLVAILSEKRAAGESNPHCSVVADALCRRHPNVYEEAGVPRWKGYLNKAKADGIVSHVKSGSAGDDHLSLNDVAQWNHASLSLLQE